MLSVYSLFETIRVIIMIYFLPPVQRCYNCQGEGHMARDCPEEDRRGGDRRGGGDCFKCGKPGHFARECNANENNNRD